MSKLGPKPKHAHVAGVVGLSKFSFDLDSTYCQH